MKKQVCLSVLFFFSLLFPFGVFADEGMWIPSLLKKINEQELKARGLKIPVEQIWSTGKPSIKDAIVHFGGGCTIAFYLGTRLSEKWFLGHETFRRIAQSGIDSEFHCGHARCDR
jgi:hypothetical protein